MEIETVINKFNLGMTSDARNGNPFECQLVKHFDNFSKKSSLIPYKDMEDSGAPTPATTELQSFQMYLGLMYVLGVVAPNTSKLYLVKTQTNDLTNPTWESATNGAAANGNVSFNLFIEYKGVLYGYSTGTTYTGIWSYTIATTSLLHDSTLPADARITATTMAQGLVHSAKDFLFIPLDNKIYYKNGAGAFTLGLTLPTGFVITDLFEDGLYLGISGYNSKGEYVSYFWDMSATSWEDSKTIVWGEGTSSFIVEKIDGYLVAVGIEGSVQPKLVFRKSYGGLQVKFREIYLKSGGINTIAGKQKYNNRLFFGLNANSSDAPSTTTYDYTAIWSVGGNGEGEFSVNIDRLPKNDTVVSRIKGFIITGDYFYVSYLTAASVYELYKTNDQVSYTASSVYETQKFNTGDSSLKKDLVGFSVMCDPLPADGVITVYYKTDDDTSWSSAILTLNTDNAISGSVVASLPKGYKEIWFKLVSTGNAVITGFTFKENVISGRPYQSVKFKI